MRRIQKKEGNGRLLPMLMWLTSGTAVWLITGLILTWVNIVHMQIGGLSGFPSYLNSLPILAIITTLLLIGIGGLILSHWRNGQWSNFHALFVLTGLLFIWYLGYWHLLLG